MLFMIGPGSISQEQTKCWRQCGPVGRCHNICIHSRGSPQRIAEFKSLSGGRLIRRDNDTRWNSWFMTLVSMPAPKMRTAISHYTANHMDSLATDRLSPTDWTALEKMAAFVNKFR